MKEPVYFLKVAEGRPDEEVCSLLGSFIEARDLLSFVSPNDMVAVKTHFGEGNSGYVRPVYFRMLGELLKSKKALPFLTETQTLYKGNRSNAIAHHDLAQSHGFGYENTALPLIMADGLWGDEEIEVEIPGRIHRSVKLATLIVKAQALVMVSHFTGHLASGFGAAIKNMGMGCSSRRGKLLQHSTAKPKIKPKACTRCGLCVRWCPAEAITLTDQSAVIDREKCIGCGQCLAVCQFDAVAYNWSATYEQLQKNVVEHAWGVARSKEGKALYINFLTRISKDCDCMNTFEKICGDIGVLAARDPVALDAASLDLVEEKSGKSLSEISYNIPYRWQIDYAEEIGFGNRHYELIEV